MASYPVLVVDHGVIEIPRELQSDPRFRDGASLQLVPVDTPTASAPADGSAWDAFLALRGILASSTYDPNAELEAEKQQELLEERA